MGLHHKCQATFPKDRENPAYVQKVMDTVRLSVGQPAYDTVTGLAGKIVGREVVDGCVWILTDYYQK